MPLELETAAATTRIVTGEDLAAETDSGAIATGTETGTVNVTATVTVTGTAIAVAIAIAGGGPTLVRSNHLQPRIPHRWLRRALLQARRLDLALTPLDMGSHRRLEHTRCTQALVRRHRICRRRCRGGPWHLLQVSVDRRRRTDILLAIICRPLARGTAHRWGTCRRQGAHPQAAAAAEVGDAEGRRQYLRLGLLRRVLMKVRRRQAVARKKA